MDLYIVIKYSIKDRYEQHLENNVNFLRSPQKKNVFNHNTEINKIYAFPDKESAIIWSSRIKELNCVDSVFVLCKKVPVVLSDSSLKDNNYVYAVKDREDIEFKDSYFFQDEVSAEIMRLNLTKNNNSYHETLKIPLSIKLKLRKEGNISGVAKELDFFNLIIKPYRF